MTESLPTGVGLTALAVADARARESARSDRLFDDPFAQLFIDAAGAAFQPPTTQDGVDIRAMRAEYVAIRTRYFDDALQAAANAGCLQVALLAAGLDTRAFRLNWPADTRLFELDMADVLAFKERVLEAHAATPTCERITVDADLREDWLAALCAAGCQPEQPTAWLAEGILMYLTEPQRDALLARITASSPPGSHLALELPAWQVAPQVAETIARGVVDRATLARVASTMHSESTATEPSIVDPSEWLTRHGWQPRVDNVADLFVGFGRAAPGVLTNVASSGPRRLAAATRAE
jgi:methyltransferase (TIGR00027 family)